MTSLRSFFFLPRFFFLATALFIAVLGSEVVELTDANFEHLTQASTGATTGDWFVAFSAPWCGHCKHLVPTWDEISLELKGEVNVAKVDATANNGLATRFGIRAFPMLKLFHQGSVYDYRGPRDAEHLLAFARGGFKDANSSPVPVPPTFLDTIKISAAEALEGVQALFYQISRQAKMVWKGEKPLDAPFVIMAVMILLFFVMIIATFASLFTGPQLAPKKKVGADKKKK